MQRWASLAPHFAASLLIHSIAGRKRSLGLQGFSLQSAQLLRLTLISQAIPNAHRIMGNQSTWTGPLPALNKPHLAPELTSCVTKEWIIKNGEGLQRGSPLQEVLLVHALQPRDLEGCGLHGAPRYAEGEAVDVHILFGLGKLDGLLHLLLRHVIELSHLLAQLVGLEAAAGNVDALPQLSLTCL